MMAEVVIAVRGGSAAKSRLSPVLSPSARSKLVEAMLEDMLEAAARTPGVSGLWVVTPTEQLAQAARRHGARVLEEAPGAGLNAAFRQALDVVAQFKPDASIVLLPGDLPLLEPKELEAAIAQAQDHPIVLTPARRGGTGAVVLRAGETFAPAFGPDSFQRHLAQAAAAGREAAVFRAASLARDFDEPEDLSAISHAPQAPRTRACLSNLMSTSEAHVPISL